MITQRRKKLPKSKLIDLIDDDSNKAVVEEKKPIKKATKAKSGAKSSTKSGAKSSTKSSDKSSAKSKTSSSAKTNVKASTKVTTKSSTKLSSKSSTKSGAKLSSKSSTKSGTKLSSKSSTKSAAKSVTKKKTATSKKKAPGSSKSVVKKEKNKATARSRKRNTNSKKSLPISSNLMANINEYYDLPYTYNKTTVKVLYQNPNTLFVYWDVSNKDIDDFKKLYGENFLKITRPVLVVHNITNNYSFEININDFANNWYIHVNDPKCKYEVKLGRRPSYADSIINNSNKTYSNYVEIKGSNTIEMPNDHVLFYKENQVLKFKNIKDNSIKERIYHFGNNISKKVKALYNEAFELNEVNNSFDLRNPSSGNPSSTML